MQRGRSAAAAAGCGPPWMQRLLLQWPLTPSFSFRLTWGARSNAHEKLPQPDLIASSSTSSAFGVAHTPPPSSGPPGPVPAVWHLEGERPAQFLGGCGQGCRGGWHVGLRSPRLQPPSRHQLRCWCRHRARPCAAVPSCPSPSIPLPADLTWVPRRPISWRPAGASTCALGPAARLERSCCASTSSCREAVRSVQRQGSGSAAARKQTWRHGGGAALCAAAQTPCAIVCCWGSSAVRNCCLGRPAPEP